MNSHNVVRSLSVTAMIATGVRWSQMSDVSPHWIAIIPLWSILLLVLAGLLFAPILVLTELWSARPIAVHRPFWVDVAFIATAYVSFIVYVRYA